MTTALDVTAPLYEDGPSIDDLQANGSPWAVRSELIEPYIEAASSIGRDEWAEVSRILRNSSSTIGYRDLAADAAGQPITTLRFGRHDGSVITERTVDDRDFWNPASLWPDGIEPEAWILHAAVLIPRARRIHADAVAQTVGADLVLAYATCAACGESRPDLETEPIERDGAIERVCRPCHATYSLVLLDRQASERLDGRRTRRDLVERFIDGRPA